MNVFRKVLFVEFTELASASENKDITVAAVDAVALSTKSSRTNSTVKLIFSELESKPRRVRSKRRELDANDTLMLVTSDMFDR